MLKTNYSPFNQNTRFEGIAYRPVGNKLRIQEIPAEANKTVIYNNRQFMILYLM